MNERENDICQTEDLQMQKDELETNEEPSSNEKVTENEKLTFKQNFIMFLKFLGFSCSAGVIQLGLNALMYEVMHITYWVSYLTGLVASVVWNFTFNRKFTFKSANNIPLAMTLVVVYYVPFTIFSTMWSDALEKAGWEGMLVTAFTMVINFITEFLWDKFVVFRKPKNKKATKETLDTTEEETNEQEESEIQKEN